MTTPFVGAGHHRLVEDLVATFDAVCAERRPRWVSLEANTGWGKTRVVQEAYARIAAQQVTPRYWPLSVLGGNAETVSVARKHVHPQHVSPDSGALPPWFWWGISCATRSGTPLNALVHDLELFTVHRTALERRFRELSSWTTRSREALRGRCGDITDAAVGEAASAVAAAANLAVPGLGLVLMAGKWGVQALTDRSAERGLAMADSPGGKRVDVVGEVAAWVERFAFAGIPLVIVVEDLHEADESLVELLARITAAPEAPVLVITTSWRGLLDQSHRAAHGLLGRVADERRRRVRCETDLPELTPDDLAAVVRLAFERLDDASTARLTSRFPNPYTLQLACQTDVIRRYAAGGSIPREIIDPLPGAVDDLFRLLWNELPAPVRRVLAIASHLAPASISRPLGLGDLRWDPELVAAAIEQVGWLAQEVPDATSDLVQSRDAYVWVRRVDEWLQRFHDPVQHDVAADGARDFFGRSDLDQLRTGAGKASGDHVSPERRAYRDRVLVALAGEGHAEWDEQAHFAVHRVCAELAETGGTAELAVALDISARAVEGNTAAAHSAAVLATASWQAGCLGETGQVKAAITQFQALLDVHTRVLGPDAPGTLATRNNLASWLARDGQVKSAIAQFQALLDDRTRVLGADHPDTLATRHILAYLLGRDV